jgi:putative ABC transport system permease protein
MVIRALDRKLLRTLDRMKMQAFAIALVVASAMALFVGTFATGRALVLSQQRYYEDQRFAHIWAHVARAPESVVARLARIPGVGAVEGRLVAQGVLDLPDVDEPATGLFISVPPRLGHALDDLYVRRGRHVEDNGLNEALVSEAFADRNGLQPGEVVRAVIAGQQVSVRIVGVALSPEFVMQIAPGGLIPDDRRFGIFWLAHDRLASLLDLRGAVNDVGIRLALRTADANVITAVDRVLDPYGGQGAFGRATQPSHVMLDAHIKPVTALAFVVPSIFLAVAIFLTNVVLSRVVATDRVQIGMLKAFGYSNAHLARHYLFLVESMVVSGILVGVPIGVWLGRFMSTWFGTFFRFPVLVFRVEPASVAIGAGAMVLAAALGSMTTLWSVVRMPPIVAMAPAPPIYRPTVVDRLGAILRPLGPPARMIVRTLTRHPVRALLTASGMAFAVAIVVFGGFTADALARVVDVRFEGQEREDLSVVLAHARSLEQWSGINELPGVRVAEPSRAVPVRLHAGSKVTDATLIGLDPSARLRRLVDMHYRSLTVPPEGVIIGGWLATQHDVHLGEPLAIEVRENRRRMVTARVAGILDEPLGKYLYMDLRALGRLLDEPNTFSTIDVLVDPRYTHEVFATLKRAPQVLGVDFRRTSLANFRAMGDDTTAFIRRIEIIFAVIIAFGVVYNTARIAVAERAYELATLRVLGFTRREISAILLGEIAALAVPAVPLGCVIGYALSAWLSTALSSELFRFPVVLAPATYAFGIIVFASASAVSALVVRRRLDRLDLVDVLKARE